MKLFCAFLCVMAAVGQTTPPRGRSVNNFVFMTPGGSYLGLGVVEIDGDRAKALKLREERGVLINTVAEGSPASKAGLKPDDVVLEYNGQRVEGYQQFVRMVSETPAGHKAVLGIVRNGSAMNVTAVVEPRPSMRDGAFNESFRFEIPPMPPTVAMPDLPRVNMLWRTGKLGIESEALNSQMADYFGVKQGVLVRMVTSGSAAERAGLKAGDVITKADGQTVTATRDISALLKSGKTVSLGVTRNHKEMTMDVLIN